MIAVGQIGRLPLIVIYWQSQFYSVRMHVLIGCISGTFVFVTFGLW